MQRRTFVKLAAASPVLLSPLYAGCSTGNAADAPGIVVGTPSTDPPYWLHLLLSSGRRMVPLRGVLRVDLDHPQQ